jgi:4-hydroxy-tetrahydrodipicolinate synthase
MLPSGSYVALVTPMDKDNKIQWHCLHNLIDWHIESKTAGIVVLGTTGEGVTISASERVRLIKETVSHVSGRVPVIVGAGTNSTQESIDRVQEASFLGADVAMTVVPYYNKPNEVGLYEHFVAIASSSDIPILLYNVPSRTIITMSSELIARLSRVSNIIGIKDATGDMRHLQEMRQLLDSNFMLFSGDDKTVVEYIENGGNGVISVLANIMPLHMANLCEALLLSDNVSIEKIHGQIRSLIDLCSIDTNPIPVKYMLYLMQKIGSGIRLPLSPLCYEKQQVVKDEMGRLGLLNLENSIRYA